MRLINEEIQSSDNVESVKKLDELYDKIRSWRHDPYPNLIYFRGLEINEIKEVIKKYSIGECPDIERSLSDLHDFYYEDLGEEQIPPDDMFDWYDPFEGFSREELGLD
jgi:hypothetical protein